MFRKVLYILYTTLAIAVDLRTSYDYFVHDEISTSVFVGTVALFMALLFQICEDERQRAINNVLETDLPWTVKQNNKLYKVGNGK